MTKRQRGSPSRPNPDDWRLRITSDGAPPASAPSPDLGFLLMGAGEMKTAATRINNIARFGSNEQIIREFHALGRAAHALGVRGMYYNNGVSVPIGDLPLPAEARRLGIDTTRQMAEGLAVKKLDHAAQMRLALAAYEAGARDEPFSARSPQPELRFENRRLSALARQKFAAAEMVAIAARLEKDKDLTDAEAVEMGHRWGRVATDLGLGQRIPYSLIRDPKDRAAAQRLGLDTPPELAEGAILSKFDKGEATAAQFALFKRGFEAGTRGLPMPVATLSERDQTANLATFITTPSLRAHYERAAAETQRHFREGLRAVEVAGLRAGMPAAEREQALKRAEALITDYASAVRRVAPGRPPSETLPDPIVAQLKEEIQRRLATTADMPADKKAQLDQKTMMLGFLESTEAALAAKGEIKPGQSRLFSPTGLMEGSLLGAVMDTDIKLAPHEAARLLAHYRRAVGDTTPAIDAGSQLNLTNAALVTSMPLIRLATKEDPLKVTVPVAAPPAVRAPGPVLRTKGGLPATATEDVRRAYLQALQELAILNNGINDDDKAAESLRRDGVLSGLTRTTSIDRETSRALAVRGLKLADAALADNTITAAEAVSMQALRRDIAAAFKGQKFKAEDAAIPEAQQILRDLRRAEEKAKEAQAR